ncbi:hypothetical protein N0V94_008183 [Neodidymelliopsis sp. IMI 364377]|nr:hypothetical protein N0V94_008183 [Neodidymelliopsis sp. IMI 364377]
MSSGIEMEDLKRRLNALERVVFDISCKDHDAKGIDERVSYTESMNGIMLKNISTNTVRLMEETKRNDELKRELEMVRANFENFKDWVKMYVKLDIKELNTQQETLRLNVQEIRKLLD